MDATNPSMPTQVVLCLPVLRGLNGTQVLLGLKKHGFGAGRVVAPGGKIEPGESPVQAAVRELHEETSVVAESESLEPAARVYFRFPYAPAADMDCTVFLARDFTGPAKATDELEPAWYPARAFAVGENVGRLGPLAGAVACRGTIRRASGLGRRQ